MTNPNNPPPAKFRQCDCCPRYSDKLSTRGWCPACERQFAEVQKRVELIRERSRLT